MIVKQHLDRIMENLFIQPVGNGYIDCICPKKSINRFIDEMDKIGISITEFTWWCFVDEGHEPCGMGGPINKYGSGWFSEIGMESTCKFSNNKELKKYLLYIYPQSNEYKECYTPAFWLDVPEDWKNPHQESIKKVNIETEQ